MPQEPNYDLKNKPTKISIVLYITHQLAMHAVRENKKLLTSKDTIGLQNMFKIAAIEFNKALQISQETLEKLDSIAKELVVKIKEIPDYNPNDSDSDLSYENLKQKLIEIKKLLQQAIVAEEADKQSWKELAELMEVVWEISNAINNEETTQSSHELESKLTQANADGYETYETASKIISNAKFIPLVF